MFVCYFIATICFSSSLVAAMSPSAAFSSALEALNTVDVHSFISFMVSLPKELAQFFQAVFEGFRLSISESPKALPVLRIDSASAASCIAPVEISTYIKAPVPTMVATLAKASSPKAYDPSFNYCEDMVMMLFIVAACFCLIKTYAYFRRVASCAFRNWQKANASALVMRPAYVQLQQSSFCEDPSFDTPTQHDVSRMHVDSWTTYSADESVLRAIFLDTVESTNVKPDVLDSQNISSVSSDTSNSSVEGTTSKERKKKRKLPRRELLDSLKVDFEMATTGLEEIRRQPKTDITTSPKATTKEAVEWIQNHTHDVEEFEKSISEIMTLMSWVRDSMKYVGRSEAACGFQNRKAPQLQKRVNACFKLFQTKFGFDEMSFFSSMRGAHALSQCFNPGSCPKIQHSQIREAYDELRQFLPRKGTMLSSLLDECLDTVRECQELRNGVAEFVLKI